MQQITKCAIVLAFSFIALFWYREEYYMEKKNEALKEKSTENICKLTVEDACKLLDTNANGLTSEEAKRRQQKYGRNIISEKKDKSPILVFLSNFTGLMAILLWTGALLPL